MRYKIVFIHPIMFIDICRDNIHKIKVIKDVIPEDSKYIRAFIDDNTGWGKVGLVIESQSFEELEKGSVIPIIPTPAFERTHVNN